MKGGLKTPHAALVGLVFFWLIVSIQAQSCDFESGQACNASSAGKID